MNENEIKEWFEKDLKNYDDPFWCYHTDLRNMLNNILEKSKETQGGKYYLRAVACTDYSGGVSAFLRSYSVSK